MDVLESKSKLSPMRNISLSYWLVLWYLDVNLTVSGSFDHRFAEAAQGNQYQNKSDLFFHFDLDSIWIFNDYKRQIHLYIMTHLHKSIFDKD